MSEARANTNLPVQLTSFIGRQSEITALRRLVGESRLVTLAGGAGMGKTRLALEVAGSLLPELSGGTWFVSLASLTEPALVPQLVAEALGDRDQRREPLLESLAAHLGAEPALLLLDNCEHLLDSSARLVEAMLRTCPDLKVLATSHEPLRVPGEAVWRVGPLATPVGGTAADGADTAGVESVRLFVARAALAEPRFALGPENLAVVAQICLRLDGIPLAIELAAARTEMMSVEDILERLEDRFRLLTGGMRTVLPRHQTLRAALDWGHQLLDDRERRLFRRLSVFAGGFDAAAAEAICSGPVLGADEVVGHLARLVDKSLVAPDPKVAGPTRYRMLGTVRQYAGERLLESGEADRIHFRHADHFLAVAERAEGFQFSPSQAAWLARLEAEHDNIRAALEWCRNHDGARWLRLATALGWFWVTHGHLGEGREYLDGALALTSLDAPSRARGLLWQARIAYWQGDHPTALLAAEQSAALYRELGDDDGAGWPLNLTGSVLMAEGRYEEGRVRLEQVLKTSHDDEVRLEALMGLGELHLQQGRLDQARRLLEECRRVATGPAGRFRGATAVLLLGVVDYLEGDHSRARGHLVEALEVFGLLGNRYAIAAALNVAAGLAIAAGRPDRALRLCAAADRLRSSIRAQLAGHWREMTERVIVEPARRALGARADSIWAEGERLTLAELLEYASAEPGAERVTEPPQGTGLAARLSRRETEVATLVARGMTNRQIADRLVLAERTIEGHVERIRGKLGVHSRTQIAVWVVSNLEGSRGGTPVTPADPPS